MLEPGKSNYLQIVQKTPYGVYLDGGKQGKVLLPNKYVPKNFALEDWLEVFVYFDSEDRLIATTLKPKGELGDIVLLEVVDVNQTGAFLDWGLEKDLLVPFSEQNGRMKVGHSYPVIIYQDKHSHRLAASNHLENHLSEYNDKFKTGQKVDLIIYRKTELGFVAVINKTHLGLLYKNEVFQELDYGMQLKGYIKKIRPDKKIDLILNKGGNEIYAELPERILSHLKQSGGTSPLTDKSPPEAIYQQYRVSKANYKKALGKLFKKKKIMIEKEKITLL